MADGLKPTKYPQKKPTLGNPLSKFYLKPSTITSKISEPAKARNGKLKTIDHGSSMRMQKTIDESNRRTSPKGDLESGLRVNLQEGLSVIGNDQPPSRTDRQKTFDPSTQIVKPLVNLRPQTLYVTAEERQRNFEVYHKPTMQPLSVKEGKKKINFSNYTLEKNDIISNGLPPFQLANNWNLTGEGSTLPHPSKTVYEPMNYSKNYISEIQQAMTDHKTLTDNLRSIHRAGGSYRVPRMMPMDVNGQVKELKPIFHGQKIYLDDYKKILEDRRKTTLQQKSYLYRNKKEAFQMTSPLSNSLKIGVYELENQRKTTDLGSATMTSYELDKIGPKTTKQSHMKLCCQDTRKTEASAEKNPAKKCEGLPIVDFHKKQRAQTQMNFYSPTKTLPQQFLYQNNESMDNKFLQKQLNIQGSENIQINIPDNFQPFPSKEKAIHDKLKSFQDIMDRHHQNPAIAGPNSSNKTLSKAKDWDIFKHKRPRKLPFANLTTKQSQSPEQMQRLNEATPHEKSTLGEVPKLNLNTLDKVRVAREVFLMANEQELLGDHPSSLGGSLHDQLSVMGRQKDIKENAFSQVSALPSYSKEASLTSNRARKEDPSFSRRDAQKQLNLINLKGLPENPDGEAGSQRKSQAGFFNASNSHRGGPLTSGRVKQAEKSQIDAVSQLNKPANSTVKPKRFKMKKKKLCEGEDPEYNDRAAKRLENLEKYVEKKPQKVRRLAEGYARSIRIGHMQEVAIKDEEEEQPEDSEDLYEAEINDEEMAEQLEEGGGESEVESENEEDLQL